MRKQRFHCFSTKVGRVGRQTVPTRFFGRIFWPDFFGLSVVWVYSLTQLIFFTYRCKIEALIESPHLLN